MSNEAPGGFRLPPLGVIRAHGADAAAFLQGQLTNDVATMQPGEWRLAGFCSAKGRLQASFQVERVDADTFHLVGSADLLEATRKRLALFVLRAKCRLEDVSSTLAAHGAADSMRLRVAAAESPVDRARADDWLEREVRSGVPRIVAATVDRFVPQMVNFELVGGVDFRKGCYPGQEVVARSQYRGTLKRRGFLFRCDGAGARPGDDVFAVDAPGEPAGTVVNAAGPWCFVEMRLAAMEGGGDVRLGGVDGARLTPSPLPYPVDLPAD